MQLAIGELAGQRSSRARIADETEHNVRIRVVVDWIICRGHG